jgi:hypothetical protein
MAKTRIERCDGASHSFVEPHARQWLMDHIIAAMQAA